MVFVSDNTLSGNSGNNLLLGTQEADLIYGLEGNDNLFGAASGDALYGGIGSDILSGNLGDDFLYGDQDDDFLYGGQGNDELFGGEGNDTLYGDDNLDRLTGGLGADVFVINSSSATGNHEDLILDFNADEDKIQLINGSVFDDLLIENDTVTGNTVIRDQDTEVVLAVLQGVESDILSSTHFLTGNTTDNFNYDQLQLITARPIESDAFLSFIGIQTAFLNSDPNALDSGHFEISLNSPENPAPYYATGLQSSPLAAGETHSATLSNSTNFTNFFSYLIDNNIDFNEIGFGYGQKSNRAFTETWNLGEDLLGQDWLASSSSTIEERIYQAEPDAVESFLTLGNTKFISFGYSPLYAVFDLGETTEIEDDIDISFTETLSVNKVSGLDNLADGLANAFLEDVNENGGQVQFFLEDRGVETPPPMFDPNTGFIVVDYPLPLSLRAVGVPEN